MDLTGRVAIVTGGGDGVGRAEAIYLAERGAALVVNNRLREGRPSTAQATVDEIVARGGNAIVDHHAVEDPASGQAMVDAALAAFGRLDIIVCNAAMTHLAPFADYDLDVFRQIVNINIWGTFYLVHAAWPVMLEQQYGRIILTTSTGGIYGFRQSTPYALTKSSLLGFARALAIDVPAGADLRINVLAPAAITKMGAGLLPQEHEAVLRTDKVAPAVAWLASDECQESGMVFRVGGGKMTRIRTVEGPVVDIPDGPGFAVDWAAFNSLDHPIEPRSTTESLARLLPAVK